MQTSQPQQIFNHTAIVFRVLYNNQYWAKPCVRPFDDPDCLCPDIPNQLVIPPKERDQDCSSGKCWEQRLCTDYKWGCTPGKRFNKKKAHIGMPAYFVFKQRCKGSALYTLWGRATVHGVDVTLNEEGFAYMHFEPFKPFPRSTWIRDLTDEDVVGKLWQQPAFRYIPSHVEDRLKSRLLDNKAS